MRHSTIHQPEVDKNEASRQETHPRKGCASGRAHPREVEPPPARRSHADDRPGAEESRGTPVAKKLRASLHTPKTELLDKENLLNSRTSHANSGWSRLAVGGDHGALGSLQFLLSA